MDPLYLVAQYPYEHIELALCSQGAILSSTQIHKYTAVADLIPELQKLLNAQSICLKDISYFCVNTGPGPYNTLRALITTANGFRFAQKTSLLQAQTLDLMLLEYHKESTLIILNAFAKHVFYAIKTKTFSEQGYCSIQELIKKINKQNEQLTVFGNGVKLYKDLLQHECANKIILLQKTPEFNSLLMLAQWAYQHHNNADLTSYLKPTYLESPAIK